jgi:phosphomannomutase
MTFPPDSLRAHLDYEPQPLKFGTSGRRGEVVHLTQLEIYIDVLAELEYLQSLPPANGGIDRGDAFYFAYDLRPSSTAFVPEQQGRGEICQAVQRAIRDAGMRPVNLGRTATPALTWYALSRAKGSIMVTGSHIPFDRNGYKLNTSRGELLKTHEEPINRAVAAVREELYRQPFAESPFNARGLFKWGSTELCPETAGADPFYLERYTNFFAGQSLDGQRILVYQHSAVARDLLVELLTRLGAEAIPAGRSDTFVPIDTENIDAEQLATIQTLADRTPADAVVSLDGDSDRPLVLGVDRGTGKVRFFPGDLLGMVVAEYLRADAVVVPISCNDAIDRGALAAVTEPKTRIGSPYVIGGMEEARAKGRQRVCGWEANGGFLLGSDIERKGRILRRLATRDAFLPIACVLFAAKEKGIPLTGLFAALPQRFSRAALLRRFPRAIGLRIVEQLQTCPERYLTPALGLGTIESVDTTDGARIRFSTGDIVHIRPSGNADELRIYAVADTQERANQIAAMGVSEPDGLLRQLERAVS